MPALPRKPPILESATLQQRERLLELFPVSSLREFWPDETGTKEEISRSVSRNGGTDQVTDFAGQYFSCCRQHIYIFKHEPDLFPTLKNIEITDGELVRESRGRKEADLLFIVKATYEIILREPLEAKKLTFLWPLRIQATETEFMVRFIVLEKNVPTYFPNRPYNFGGRNVDEKSLLHDIQNSLATGLEGRDLHKGLKYLWANDKIDSNSAGFKKPKSTAFEAMDGIGLIKEDNPDLYKEIKDLELFKTVFEVISDDWPSIEKFQAEPRKGILNFLSYSENNGDVDSLVGEILRHNK